MDLILKHPVMTLNNEELLPAGTEITTDVMEGLLSNRKQSLNTIYPFLKHSTVAEDLLTFIHSYPYNNLFHSTDETRDLLKEMEHVYLTADVLESLDYFKDNDIYSYRHCLLVFALSTLLATDLISHMNVRLELTSTGPAHDIGKTCVSFEILKKVDPLTRDEKIILDNHALAGYVLLSYYMGSSDLLAPLVARDHHERRDGSGKPTGKNLNNFMVEIIAVCDIYDALISPRPYRAEAYDNRTALEEIVRMADENEIDLNIVRSLIARNRKAKPHYKEFSVSHEKRGIQPKENSYGIVIDNR